jgi:hypothetical protein
MRFFAAWLGLHALLLQLLLPIFHHPEHVFASRAELATALLAVADAGTMPATHHSGDGKAPPSCPLCLSIQHAQAFLPPTAPTLPLSPAHREAIALAPPRDMPHWANLAARARAPPLAV